MIGKSLLRSDTHSRTLGGPVETFAPYQRNYMSLFIVCAAVCKITYFKRKCKVQSFYEANQYTVTSRRLWAYTGIRAVLRLNQGKGVDDMLQSLGWAALGTGFTFGMTTLGAALVFFMDEEPHVHIQRAVLGFAAGVMTAASVWGLLIPAIDKATGRFPDWLPAAVGMLTGVIFLAVLDSLLPRLRKRGGPADEAWQNQTLLMTAITLHNVPEGMAVGLAFALAATGENFAGAAALALGIGIQNFPEGAAIALPLRPTGKGRAFCKGMLSGIVEPIFGILVVLAAGWAEALMPWLLSFAAGAMLYVVVEELIPQAHSRAGTCGFVGGFLIMMVLDTALG